MFNVVTFGLQDSIKYFKRNLAKKNEYKVIADGIISSFVSRNNDVDGYWGIGKLYSLSTSLNADVTIIDLIERSITPKAERFLPMINHYSQKLVKLQDKRGLSKESLKDVKIYVSCTRNLDITVYDSWSPHLVSCEIKLTLENGSTFTQVRSVRCRPHDPKRELKSTRTYNEHG